nr:SJCHGC03240 protein [Schistosoma japonicum]
MAPFWEEATNSCVFQADHEWFDCTASESLDKSRIISRFCPCRNALPDQISLCSHCF